MAHLFCRSHSPAGFPRKVVLFGSYARNEQRQFPDIDVAMVADEFTGFGCQDVGLLGDAVIRQEFVAIESHTFPPEQFTDRNPFVREIKRNSILAAETERG